MKVSDISDEDMRDLLSAKDVGTGRQRLKRILAKHAQRTVNPTLDLAKRFADYHEGDESAY